MARSKTIWQIHSEYWAFSALLNGFRLLPLSWSRPVARFFTRTLLHLMPKRRRLMEAQIAACYPEWSISQRNQLISQSINHLADGIATFTRINANTLPAMDASVETVGFEHLEDAYRRGKGMITFTAHYGCWEWMAIYVTRHFPRVAMVVRPLDNPRVDERVTRTRRSGGGGVIDSRLVFRQGLRLLRSNGILGVLVDQNFYKGGVFVDFFGRPAATNTLVPILARRTDCVVLPMHNVWVGNKIRIICEPPLELSKASHLNQAILEDTQAITRYVEGWIRQDPSQWMWLHNRWKRRPEVAV